MFGYEDFKLWRLKYKESWRAAVKRTKFPEWLFIAQLGFLSISPAGINVFLQDLTIS